MTISERRSLIAPPEMMKGSTSGRTSSHISAVVMRIGQIEKMQGAVAPREPAGICFVEQSRDETIYGMEHQLVQRPLAARAGGGRVLPQRQLKERVQLHGRAAALGVLDDHPAGADVARAAKRAGGRTLAQAVQHPQVSVAQVPAPVCHASLRVEQ